MIGVESNSNTGGTGSVTFPNITGDPRDNTALAPYLDSIVNLENNEFKYLYWASVSSSSGTIAIPTGATILLGEINGLNALVETISGNPTGNSPVTSGGSSIVVSSFNVFGNYVLSGTPSAYPVAVVFVIKTKAKFISNININNVIAEEQVVPVPRYLCLQALGTGNITGTTANTIVGSLFVPKSEYSPSKLLLTIVAYYSITSATVRLYLNATNSLTGATLVGTHNTGNYMGRNLIVSSPTTLKGIDGTIVQQSDNGDFASGFPFNINQDYYFIVAIQPATTAAVSKLTLMRLIYQ